MDVKIEIEKCHAQYFAWKETAPDYVSSSTECKMLRKFASQELLDAVENNLVFIEMLSDYDLPHWAVTI